MATAAALIAFLGICLVWLCGPLALLAAVWKRYGIATVLSIAALYLGVFWYETVYTEWRYLGLVSANCGLVAFFLAIRTYITNGR